MDDKDKLEVCNKAANCLMKRGYRNVEKDALVNIGFTHILVDGTPPADVYKLAFAQAYAWMRRLCLSGGLSPVHNLRKYPILNEDRRVIRVTDGITLDELIDVRDAIESLPDEEKLLVSERFFEGMSFQEMADRHCMNCRGSMSFRMRRILWKLKCRLSK
jgi:hypothetical protein